MKIIRSTDRSGKRRAANGDLSNQCNGARAVSDHQYSASRIEEATKELQARLFISEAVRRPVDRKYAVLKTVADRLNAA